MWKLLLRIQLLVLSLPQRSWEWLLDRVYDVRESWGQAEARIRQLELVEKEHLDRIDFLQRELIQERTLRARAEAERTRFQDEHMNDLRRVADRMSINSTGKAIFGVISVEEIEGQREERPRIVPTSVLGSELRDRVREYNRRKLAEEQEALASARN